MITRLYREIYSYHVQCSGFFLPLFSLPHFLDANITVLNSSINYLKVVLHQSRTFCPIIGSYHTEYAVLGNLMPNMPGRAHSPTNGCKETTELSSRNLHHIESKPRITQQSLRTFFVRISGAIVTLNILAKEQHRGYQVIALKMKH